MTSFETAAAVLGALLVGGALISGHRPPHLPASERMARPAGETGAPGSGDGGPRGPPPEPERT